jgi:hypothetical protein
MIIKATQSRLSFFPNHVQNLQAHQPVSQTFLKTDHFGVDSLAFVCCRLKMSRL